MGRDDLAAETATSLPWLYVQYEGLIIQTHSAPVAGDKLVKGLLKSNFTKTNLNGYFPQACDTYKCSISFVFDECTCIVA